MNADFTKEEFHNFWGKDGYYENFNYGVGIDKVIEKTLAPFFDINKCALEIGCGGGIFTEYMIGRFGHVIGIDVIAMPEKFETFKNFHFVEADNQDYSCKKITGSYIDFCFSYGTFCHLSNEALKEYFNSIHRVLKPGADFVFMLSNFEKIKEYYPDDYSDYQLGNKLPIGHFVQDERTVDLLIGNKFSIINKNMIPEHRDLIVHLKKI